jgi:hypothetical protein
MIALWPGLYFIPILIIKVHVWSTEMVDQSPCMFDRDRSKYCCEPLLSLVALQMIYKVFLVS